ncbi:MFS transporter [Pseudomonas sp. I2]|uniref:MFS transporter n=1 Tax=Pseudomonas sp. I2 TaxID=1338438 RepID=UPI0034D687DF
MNNDNDAVLASMPQAQTSHAATGGRTLTRTERKAIVAATLGTIVEYTDWVIYATFSSILARQFFPAEDKLSALLSVLAVFAVGFLMRPIGGAVLGVFADRYGRKKGLTLSILMMSLASLVIGLCPNYESIGIAAPIILVLARLAQGFSAGGEFGSASAFLIESAAPERRAFAGSWQWFAINAGTLVSFLLGFTLASVGSETALETWGWRVAFVIAALLGLVTLWIRLSVRETEVFTLQVEKKAVPKRPLREIFTTYRKDVLRVIGIAMAGNMLNYVWMVSYPSQVHLLTGMSIRDTLLAGSVAVGVSLLLMPLVGTLADRVGRRPVLIAFAVGAMLWAWPSFALLYPGIGLVQVALLQTVSMVILTGFGAASAVTMAEQFPTQVRVTGIALPYALSVTLFGGTSPYIMTAMAGWGIGHLFWLYIVLIALVSCITYVRMPEMKGQPLR